MSGKPQMTARQAQATEPDLTAWVGASAGTGKTHVLTARVLRLMLTGTDPANILCLTFTKAAAAEMKTRIFGELGKWVRMEDQDLAVEIHRRTQESLDSDGLKHARRLFARVLELPGGLQIQTFHSFCQSLLGRFPLEAGLEPGFEALDEQMASQVMREARDLMLSDTLSPDRTSLRQALEQIAVHVSEDTFDQTVTELDSKRQVLARARRAYGSDQGFRQALWQALELAPGTSAADAGRAITDYFASRRTDMLRLGNALADHGSKTMVPHGHMLQAFCAATGEDQQGMLDDLQGYFLTQKLEPKAMRSMATAGVLKADPGIEDLVIDLQASMVRLSASLVAAKVAEATDALMTLALAQLDHYRANKDRTGRLDFEDLISHAVGMLDSAAIAPWILFKLDGGLDHILVDEAQDTNAAQWKVIRELAGEFFGQHAEKARTVFAVGDAKQSIYSFQGSDPQEFLDARDRIFLQAKDIGAPRQNIQLNQSFRSGEAVLSLVDAVFHEEGNAFYGLSGDDEKVIHEFAREGAAGLVEMWPLVVPEEKESRRPWEPPLVQERAEDAAERLATRIADHIADMIRGGDLLEARGRPVRPGDIMILVQRRSSFVEYLETALNDRRVPVAGRDRMTLAEELPVMDLIALGRFVLQPDDDLTLAEVLKSPLCGLDDEQLFDLAWKRGGSLYEALRARGSDTGFDLAAGFLARCLASAEFHSPFGFFSMVLNDFDGRRRLAGRLGNETSDVLDEFLEQALAFERDHVPSLASFVQTVSQSSLQIKRDLEEGTNAVRVMTVHGSKGLQAPIVYMPDTVRKKAGGHSLVAIGDDMPAPLVAWSLSGHPVDVIDEAKEQLDLDRDDEYRRELYVAMTRAEDRLYICGWETRRGMADGCWYDLISQGMDRLSGVETLEGDVRQRRIAQTSPVVAEGVVPDDAAVTSQMPAWVREPAPEEATPPRPLAPSRPLDEGTAGLSPLAESQDARRFGRGNLVHTLLEWLPEVDAGERRDRAIRWLSRQAKELSDGEIETLWQEVRAVLENAAFAPIFGPGSRAEVQLTGVVGDSVVSAQLDRLLVQDDEILVVDYKTNRPPPFSVESVDKAYLRQLAVYRSLLASLWPDRPVRAALLWTDRCDLMEIPGHLLDPYAPGGRPN